MSRTDKDMPLRIQEEDGRGYRYCGYRGGRREQGKVVGGMYKGISGYTRWYWKTVRQQERLALLRAEEPEPARPRHDARWMYY